MYFRQMMKGLLVYRINKDDPSNTGVIKKCLAQQEAFSHHGIQTDMLWLSKKGVLKNSELIKAIELPPHSLKVYGFYFFYFGTILKSLESKEQYDFIYLRHPFFDPLLVSALQQIKKRNQDIKIILEINTYPYDAEPKRILHKASLSMDKYFRKNAHQYVDRIVDYGVRKTIWQIPTLSIRNGINLDNIPFAKRKSNDGKLRMIAVGNWSYWHGLDRLILGIKDYIDRGERAAIELLIVGDGPETESLRNLVNEYNLGERIIFSPATFGTDLDKLFESADVGIGTLGLHRKNVTLDSSLKHREYCARGLPFILSSPDLDFPDDLNFIHYVPSNDDRIDIVELIKWYALVEDRTLIRQYAERQITWKAQLRPIVNHLLQ